MNLFTKRVQVGDYTRPKCETKVNLDPEFLQYARDGVGLTHERGGNMKFDSKGNLTSRELTTGQYARIVMPRSIVDFHSHPGKCKKDMCALGIPSPADMKNIVIGALTGSNAHMVFAKEGTYVIRVSDAKLIELWDTTCEVIQFLADIDSTMDSLHRQFIQKKFSYPSYVQQWMALAQQLGFEVNLFPPGEDPWVMVRYHCDGTVLDEPGAAQTLDVPDSLDFLQKYQSSCTRRRATKRRKK